jgi:hypothetical protein
MKSLTKSIFHWQFYWNVSNHSGTFSKTYRKCNNSVTKSPIKYFVRKIIKQ